MRIRPRHDMHTRVYEIGQFHRVAVAAHSASRMNPALRMNHTKRSIALRSADSRSRAEIRKSTAEHSRQSRQL